MKRSRTIGVAAILSAALTGGCNAIIDATAGTPMPEANSSGGAAGAGGQGGANGSGGIGGSGGMGGQGGAVPPVACVPEVCVLDKAVPTAECQPKSILEYGSMTPGMDAVRLVRINNPCEDDAALISAAINGFGPDFDQAFKSTILQYEPDPITPGVFQRIERPLPTKLPGQTTLYVEVSLHAPFVPGPLSDGHLLVGTQVNNMPGADINVPIIGDITNCDAGTGDCDGSPQTACETDLLTSVDHCGECGSACSLPNATSKCSAGACAVDTCATGFADCNGVATDGCEVELATNVGNCGACGTACSTANGTPACVAGACAVGSCNAGFGDCDQVASNGCELSLTADANNCGTCGNICQAPNGTAVCTMGACSLSMCNAGYGNCDQNGMNGCEANLSTDVNNCKNCGTICNLPNANQKCGSAGCEIGSCNAGYGNCDQNGMNGCETSTSNNVNHCGTCGKECVLPNASPQCTGGACMIATCNAGFGNCNAMTTDGCEANLNTDINNCKACGTKCNPPNANPGCSTAGCFISSCFASYVDLDKLIPNGCECKITNTVDLPDDSFLDENCDGIDGTEAKAIFVAPTSAGGNDANLGTKTKPVASITVAIQKAISGGKTQILVSSGTYSGRVTLANGLFLAGGYAVGQNFTWARSAVNPKPIIESTTDGANGRIAVYGENLTSSTVVDRMVIRTTNTSGAGVSNYAMYIKNGPGLTLMNSELIAGNAGPGVNGVPGMVGAAGGAGGPGGGGSCSNGDAFGAGGYAGASSCNMTGGIGGNGGPKKTNGQAGGSGNWNTLGGSAGGAGDPGTPGGPGSSGTPGVSGSNGAGGTGGDITTGFWVGGQGSQAGTGTPGNGGGGGGGGGGQTGILNDKGSGNGGGGGGGGGCGGTGGGGGKGGGGAFGLFLVNSAAPTIRNNSIKSGNGGNGGSGVVGGNGGAGGAGGAGAGTCINQVGAGGNGGNGGPGGSGGYGGGGAGGPSFSIFRVNTNPILTGMNAFTFGSPGTGGSSPGNPGANGASGQIGQL